MPPDSTTHTACLAVVMPVFNEAGSVAAILGRVLAQPCVAEVVVVDDGSTDGTAERLVACAERRVALFKHDRNRGKGAAIQTGLAAVRAPWVVIQDADLEYDPGDYVRMLEVLVSGQADVVYGSRFLEHSSGASWRHRLANRGLTWAANRVTGLELTDVHTCLKMMSAALLRELELREPRFEFCVEVTARLARRPELCIVEVPVSYQPRDRQAGKKIGARDGMRALWFWVREAWGRRRLRS